MDVKQSYGIWASLYDSDDNKTRDLEALALKTALTDIRFYSCLEIGCGTGKNTEWLITKAKEKVTAVDFSPEMLSKAKEKVTSENVRFIEADITKDWTFLDCKYDIVCFSLVLEHVENLEYVFREASKAVDSGGLIYIGELHPFRQYTGSKARFDSGEGKHVLICFNHHISDFISSAKKHGFEIMDVKEFFDDDKNTNIPRILTLLFKKV